MSISAQRLSTEEQQPQLGQAVKITHHGIVTPWQCHLLLKGESQQDFRSMHLQTHTYIYIHI